MLRAWFAALVAAVAVAPAPADDRPAGPSRGPYVVIVGVGSFADPAIQPRPTAEADARLLYDLLRDPKHLKAAAGRVVLLTGTPDAGRSGKPATRENVTQAVRDAVAATGKDDPIILAWFGRGASAGDKTALFTADTTFAERAKTAVLGSDLEAELKDLNDRNLCVLLDVEFKGFDPGKEAVPDPTLRDVTAAVFGGDERGEAPAPVVDRVLFLGTDLTHDPLPAPDGGHGLFAHTLVKALGGAADTDGYEPDGLVTVDELSAYVEKEVADQARRIGKTTKEKEAVPFIVGVETAHFGLTRNPGPADAADARLAKLADLRRADQVTAEAAEEGLRLLSRMPKLKARQQLRKLYQQLADGALAPDAFAKQRADLLDGLKVTPAEAGRFARTVLRAADRVQDRYVKEVPVGELVGGAVAGLYRRLDQPLPDDLAAAAKDAKTLPPSKLVDLLRAARERLGKREDLADGKDVDLAILMLTAALNDPYTVYLDKATIEKTASQLKGEFRGVGIQIRRDSVRDGLLVVSPIKGSPAYKAGVLAGDLITEIRRDVDPRGEPLGPDQPRVVSTKGMKTEQALDLILGKPGVPVTLVAERDKPGGGTEVKEFTIKRGVVAVETVLGVARDDSDDWRYFLDPQAKIAYVQLTQFSPATFRELQAVLRDLKADGARGLVLDLRYNPGGLLLSAVQVCNLFVEDGLVVSVRPRVGDPERWFARGEVVESVRRGGRDPYPGRGKDERAYADFPMAVLVNEFSASAAEIVSACLQDYNRAVVVGARTFGKGSVQSIEPFGPTDGQIKLTTARYFPPLGRNIDKLSSPSRGKDANDQWGVKPNDGFAVELSREDKADLAERFRDRELIPRRDLPAKVASDKKFVDKQLDKAVDYVRGLLKDKPADRAGK